ncbi:hypothetical protein L6164_007322 [Bauhinia variegata]|uniref:Uncharacterized protein n=1 Tax=Bauhinia variegata TaxID=167791 RepID=A0ACB9PG12_BAUVA|nr:hypothetical protein L6164_007322 [Bauhinia variegata]
MVGNAVTDNYYDNLGTVTYWWSHAMISDRTYRRLINTCHFHRQKSSDECESLYSYAMDQEFGKIYQYNIYAPPGNVKSDDSSGATHHTMHLPHRPHHPIVLWTVILLRDTVKKSYAVRGQLTHISNGGLP